MRGTLTRPAIFALLALTALLLLAMVAACSAPPPAGAPPQKIAAQATPAHAAGKAAPAGPTTKDIGTGVHTQPQAQAKAASGPAKKLPANTTLATFSTADFAGAGVCAACHTGLKNQAGADVSMPEMWRSTMMANSARDPIWQAKVSSEVKRAPALQEVIEKKCTTCHMPMAETEAVTEGTKVAALGDGFYNAANPLHAAAIDGVSCTLCHQLRDTNFGKMESFSGGYTVDVSTNPPDRPLFGPYQQPVGQVMQASTGYNPIYGAHMESAEHCATCHNLYTPYIDAQGNVLGEFPEQTPYTEWQNSSFSASNQSCQGCHMPQAQGGVVISTVPAGLQERQPFFQHFFVGGNAFMLGILRDWGVDLGVTADAQHFNATLDRVGTQVGQRAAALQLKRLELNDGTVTAQLQVSALTGHKFPASFPSRRAWLHVTVKDAAGELVFESGAHQADGSIAGNDADSDAARFEPHYDVITSAEEVQIYEPIMGNNEGQVTYQLLRAAVYLKDNRLLPSGADKAKLPADIAVYGEAANDTNFAGGSDLVTYRVDVGDATGPFTVNAELLYEPISYRFIQDLISDTTPEVQRFEGYYNQSDRTALVAAALEPAETK